MNGIVLFNMLVEMALDGFWEGVIDVLNEHGEKKHEDRNIEKVRQYLNESVVVVEIEIVEDASKTYALRKLKNGDKLIHLSMVQSDGESLCQLGFIRLRDNEIVYGF